MCYVVYIATKHRVPLRGQNACKCQCACSFNL